VNGEAQNAQTPGRVRQLFPDGTWSVDRRRSEIGFAVKSLWGLATVRGTFDAFEGTVTSRDGALTGKLQIDAASLDTGNRKRDTHLRSADFFDVDRRPHVTFAASAIDQAADGPVIVGELAVASSRVPLRIPIGLTHEPDGTLRLTGGTTIERAAAGMTWNWLGSVRGSAKLNVHLALQRVPGG